MTNVRSPETPFAEVRSWLFDAALPYWAEHGRDIAHGGFLEELDASGGATSIAFKRVRVTCRQIYVFSHAALLGWREGAALADIGYAYLLSKAHLGGGAWARRLSREGAVIDGAPDLYDLAFVLFALGWRYRLTQDREALAHAHATLDFIQNTMRAREGYWAALPAAAPLLQNPHMHLTEACLVLFEATREQRFLDQATDNVALFRRRFFDGATLGEYFTADWARLPGELEPGHQFEWAWILAQHARLAGGSAAPEIATLVDYAETHGVDPRSGVTYDGLSPDGAPVRRTGRTWPTTERIKGWLALFETSGRDPNPALASAVRVLLDRYLKPNGAWVDLLDETGTPVAGPAPASTFYHVFLAFAEVLRLEPKLTGGAPNS